MTDAHYHRSGNTLSSLDGREFRFCGIHPWDSESADLAGELAKFRSMLEADDSLGVGEIGLDRLKVKAVTQVQREVFAAQLELAAEMGRPVVLHGAKCWGEVVKAVRPYAGRIPAFLFHGFSRSDGLIPEILNRDIIDDVCIVTDDEALTTARALAAREGILCGISSGTNVAAAIKLARKLGRGKTVVTVLPDTAERYFSTPLFD